MSIKQSEIFEAAQSAKLSRDVAKERLQEQALERERMRARRVQARKDMESNSYFEKVFGKKPAKEDESEKDRPQRDGNDNEGSVSGKNGARELSGWQGSPTWRDLEKTRDVHVSEGSDGMVMDFDNNLTEEQKDEATKKFLTAGIARWGGVESSGSPEYLARVERLMQGESGKEIMQEAARLRGEPVREGSLTKNKDGSISITPKEVLRELEQEREQGLDQGFEQDLKQGQGLDQEQDQDQPIPLGHQSEIEAESFSGGAVDNEDEREAE